MNFESLRGRSSKLPGLGLRNDAERARMKRSSSVEAAQEMEEQKCELKAEEKAPETAGARELPHRTRFSQGTLDESGSPSPVAASLHIERSPPRSECCLTHAGR